MHLTVQKSQKSLSWNQLPQHNQQYIHNQGIKHKDSSSTHSTSLLLPTNKLHLAPFMQNDTLYRSPTTLEWAKLLGLLKVTASARTD